jgi:hypothetical protein
MVAVFSASGGRIVCRNAATGAIRFDSDEKLFQATQRIAGAITLGPWTASFVALGSVITDVNTDVNYTLASINSACDTVVGAFKVTTSSTAYGVNGLGWFQAGGTYLHYFDAAIPGNRTVVQEFVSFTFSAAGGSLLLNERAVLRAIVGLGEPNNTITVPAITFDYNLYVGSFV